MTLGCILLLTNLVMQIGLTFIVGQGVIVSGNAWRKTLVGVDMDDQLASGQVAEDMSLLATGFDRFLTEMDAESDLGRNQTEDAQSKLNDETISQLKTQLGEKEAEEASLESGFQLQPRKKSTALLQERGNLRVFRQNAGATSGGMPSAPGIPYKAAGADTLCSMKGANYTCFPPTAKFAPHFDKLDTNGDGVWSLEEAQKDANGFEKKFKAKPFLVFRAISVGLTDRTPMDPKLWIAPEVKEMKAIPKVYFDYWMGDAILCTYADPYICPTLLKRGFFNEAMNPKNPGKNIQDIDGALDYCVWMLEVGGGCEQSFPQIYRLYRARRQMQCGEGSLYKDGLFKNPYHEVDRVYIAAVDYDALGNHLKAQTLEYRFFLFLVLILWLFSLLGEGREMLKLAEFCIVAPTAGADGGLEVTKGEDDAEQYTITGLESGHRMVIGFICFVRVMVVIYLGIVGCIFLVMETGYMDLLMNAVALAFILEVDEILFGSVARASTCDDLEALQDVEFETQLPTTGCSGWLLQKDFWGIIMFPIIAITLIMCFSIFTTSPVLDALNCACYQTGDQCTDSHLYGKDFWNNYWCEVLPNAMAGIQKMKEQAGR